MSGTAWCGSEIAPLVPSRLVALEGPVAKWNGEPPLRVVPVLTDAYVVGCLSLLPDDHWAWRFRTMDDDLPRRAWLVQRIAANGRWCPAAEDAFGDARALVFGTVATALTHCRIVAGVPPNPNRDMFDWPGPAPE